VQGFLFIPPTLTFKSLLVTVLTTLIKITILIFTNIVQ
jgi:hypothetical protein